MGDRSKRWAGARERPPTVRGHRRTERVKGESLPTSHGVLGAARPRALLLVFPAFVAVALVLYAPCLRGPFVSDDAFAVLNPYATPLGIGKVLDLFSPYGATTTMQYEYRPVWFLLHGIERQMFGDSAFAAYHVINVVLHSVVSTLLVLLFVRSGLPPVWALLGGALFLVHPANVEAVAWISQLTSCVALAFALGAFLLARRSPVAALLAFTLAVLTKPLATFAFPVAVLSTWVEDRDGHRRTARWIWLAAWLIPLTAFTAIEFIAARHKQFGVPPIAPDTMAIVRTIVADFLRYLVMAATGYGTSAFQQARPALSWLEPWWLGGAVALVLVGWRALHMLVRRRQEGVFWGWTLVAFALVSQIVPLIYPMADRYLYFMLPGLIGAGLLAAHSAVERWPKTAGRIMVLRLSCGVALLWVVALAVQAPRRAALWASFDELAQDSMRNYPNGIWAHLLRSRIAAQKGDGEHAAAELRGAFELGNREWGSITTDPAYASVLRHPSFQKLLVDMADWWIARVHEVSDPDQIQLVQLASAYWLKGDFAAAQSALERAARLNGPLNDRVQADLSRLRRRGSS